MRKTTPILLAILLSAATACEQRTETQTVTDSSGTVQTKTTTVSATTPSVNVPAVDTTATARAKDDAKDAAHDAGVAAREAAHATGTALEKAGKEIQRRTNGH